MSRSIHATRRQAEQEEQADYADSDQQAARISILRGKLAKKRRVKVQLVEEHTPRPYPTALEPELVPILVADEGDCVHYPASLDDIRSVMRLLPGGALDGIESVELCLGSGFQMRPGDLRFRGTEPDPYTHRQGDQSLPGVFTGRSLGVYAAGEHQIRIFAYVYDLALPQRVMWELYMRLLMLSTFVHEVAHHHDNTARIARGRWLFDSREKAEVYAERMQHEWTQNYVVPYLKDVYPDQCEAMEVWMDRFGGAPLSLATLAGDPRSTRKGGGIAVKDGIFTIHEAVEHPARDVADGKGLEETRLNFANELHYTTRYEEALQIIKRVRAECPSNQEAVTLEADIYVHQERYEEALPLVTQTVTCDRSHLPAWRVLADIYTATEDWQRLLVAATHIIKLSRSNNDRSDRIRGLEHRARALLELGWFARLRADLDKLAQFSGHSLARRVKQLRAEMASRQALNR